jgi:hypothetical protein
VEGLAQTNRKTGAHAGVDRAFRPQEALLVGFPELPRRREEVSSFLRNLLLGRGPTDEGSVVDLRLRRADADVFLGVPGICGAI